MKLTLCEAGKNDNLDEHVSDTPEQQVQAAQATTSLAQPKLPTTSEDAPFIGQTHQTSSAADNLQAKLPAEAVDLRDEGEQTVVPGSTIASGSSGTDTPSAPSHHTKEGFDSLTLPSIPDSSGFDLSDLDLLGKADIRPEGISISTSGSTGPFEQQQQASGTETETAISPIRTLFPLTPQGFRGVERVIVPQSGGITHARAAKLQARIEEVEKERDHWMEGYHEVERKLDKLQRLYNDREKELENHAAMGVDW